MRTSFIDLLGRKIHEPPVGEAIFSPDPRNSPILVCDKKETLGSSVSLSLGTGLGIKNSGLKFLGICLGNREPLTIETTLINLLADMVTKNYCKS